MKTPYGLTPAASKNNDFTRHLSEIPSVFNTNSAQHSQRLSVAQTAVIKRKREAGVTVQEVRMVRKKTRPVQHYVPKPGKKGKANGV